MKKQQTEKAANEIVQFLTDFISKVPESNLSKSEFPQEDSKDIISDASWKAASVSGALALPPGPLGMLTILPELIGVWKIQAQMVADVAAVHGKTAVLSKEAMLYCLFKHGAGHLFRDIVVRAGERVLVKRVTLRALQSILTKLGFSITQRAIGRAVARWIPIAGAVAIGAYAKYDTSQVGETAQEFFASEFEQEKTKDDNKSEAA